MSFIRDVTNRFTRKVKVNNENWFYNSFEKQIFLACFDDTELQSLGIHQDVEPSEIACIIHPDDLEYFDSSKESLINQGVTCRLNTGLDQVKICHLKMTFIDSQETKGVVTNRYRVAIQDALKSEVSFNKEVRVNYKAMLEQTDDYIFFKDRNHVYTAVSQSLSDIKGKNRSGNHLGLTAYDIFPKDHADNYHRLEKEIFQSEKSSVGDVQPFYDEEGKQGWISNRKYPVKINGEVVGLFGVARVVTKEVLSDKQKTVSLKQLTIRNHGLERLVTIDPLTGVNHRVRFNKMLEAECFRTKRDQDKLSFILIDIDHFKRINDLFGHQVGDNVLVKLSQLFKEHLRGVDTLGRWCGEEFAIYVPQASLGHAVCLAEKIRLSVEEFSFPAVGYITASLGVTSYRQGDSPDQLVKRASTALYKAKCNGRNRVEVEYIAEVS